MIIPSYVITAAHETDRAENLALLHEQLEGLARMEAVYPSHIHVPFLQQLMALSKQRTGTALNQGEIGVLLSNRKIWREITRQATDDTTLFLVLESDSVLLDAAAIKKIYPPLCGAYDLFFFGAWSGHMKLERSTKKKIGGAYTLGTPFIKTVYGAYGYAINRKAALHLLRQTARPGHPVDQFKYFIKKGELKLGGVAPEMISHLEGRSMIGHPVMHPLRKKLWMLALDIKNYVICLFK